MGLKKKLVTQVRNPRGTFGRIVAKMMNKRQKIKEQQIIIGGFNA